MSLTGGYRLFRAGHMHSYIVNKSPHRAFFLTLFYTLPVLWLFSGCVAKAAILFEADFSERPANVELEATSIEYVTVGRMSLEHREEAPFDFGVRYSNCLGQGALQIRSVALESHPPKMLTYSFIAAHFESESKSGFRLSSRFCISEDAAVFIGLIPHLRFEFGRVSVAGQGEIGTYQTDVPVDLQMDVNYSTNSVAIQITQGQEPIAWTGVASKSKNSTSTLALAQSKLDFRYFSSATDHKLEISRIKISRPL